MRRMGVRQRGMHLSVLVLGMAITPAPAPVAVAQDQSTPPAAARPTSTLYTVGPTDVLQIIVWKEPDLTRDVTVRFDGMITVPLLGDVPAAGRTPDELAETLDARGSSTSSRRPG